MGDISDSRTQARRIIRLPPEAVNRIAAGEVVERPSAAVKELVENALDAGARAIRVRIERGGLQRILIEDDGCGMTAEELCVAMERHATSKLEVGADGSIDLLNIRTMGFRGEALPSIGSVSRMTITSRTQACKAASCLVVEAGALSQPAPAPWVGAAPHGTRIDVRDLFFATPARLAFLRSERAEAAAVADALRRTALARPDVAFHLDHEDRTQLRLQAEPDAGAEALLRRQGAILGEDFRANAMRIDAERDGVRVYGYAGLPTYNRGSAQHQYLFVNGRPVKDRLITGVVRAAYQDFLARDRHPVAVLYVDLDPEQVDVNVHPAKTEVRFRDPGAVRGLLIGALRHALAAAGHRASTTVAGMALGALRKEGAGLGVSAPQLPWGRGGRSTGPSVSRMAGAVPLHERLEAEISQSGLAEEAEAAFDPGASAPCAAPADGPGDAEDLFPLGRARAQLHETYIVAETKDGIILVDQHAAHERLVYERMKAEMAASGVRRQALLIPEIVELSEDEAARVLARAEELLALGLEIEPFGRGAVAVRAAPALFGLMDMRGLLRDLADELADLEAHLALSERFEQVMGDMACRGSVRAGRKLSLVEMDALLREMEATPHSGQCNHGRPTYVELKRADVERLFGRR